MERSGPGYSPEEPIEIGGGWIFAAFNERQYFNRLRGPDGAPVSAERLGSIAAAPHILDHYRVESPGLTRPADLFLDPYTPGPPVVAPGFVVDAPDAPWLLATSTIANDSTPPPDAGAPRKWEIVGSEGEIVGYVDWDGTSVAVDMPPATGKLLSALIDRFLQLSPELFKCQVLRDTLEAVLPWESNGLLRATPADFDEPFAQETPGWAAQAGEGHRRRGWWHRG
jgi:hypothetical protein